MRRIEDRSQGKASPEALLLDGLGTLVDLCPPAPLLVERLRVERGVKLAEPDAERAFAAEISYYRAHHLEGGDTVSLGELRTRCAEVLRGALPPSVAAAVTTPQLVGAMLASIRFRAFPEVGEVMAELRTRGLRLAVVSNWDVSLVGILHELGLDFWLEHVVTSAAVGAAKPNPVPFERALDLLGLEAGSVIHVGDSWTLDVLGAREAGISSILIDRCAAAGETREGVPVLGTLRGLLDLDLGAHSEFLGLRRPRRDQGTAS